MLGKQQAPAPTAAACHLQPVVSVWASASLQVRVLLHLGVFCAPFRWGVSCFPQCELSTELLSSPTLHVLSPSSTLPAGSECASGWGFQASDLRTWPRDALGVSLAMDPRFLCLPTVGPASLCLFLSLLVYSLHLLPGRSVGDKLRACFSQSAFSASAWSAAWGWRSLFGFSPGVGRWASFSCLGCWVRESQAALPWSSVGQASSWQRGGSPPRPRVWQLHPECSV